MCVIYNGTVYLRCSDCNTINLASASSFRAITQCEADDNRACPLGLRPLEKRQNITIPDIRRCHECEQLRAEQRRTIHSLLGGKHAGRGRGRVGVQHPVRMHRPEATVRNSRGRNTYLETFLAGSGAVAGSGVANAANPSMHPQPAQTQQFHRQPQAENIFDMPEFSPPSVVCPPLPEFNPDLDVEEILNMDMTFAPAAPQLEVEREGAERQQQGEKGEEEEVVTVDHHHKHELVDNWLDCVFDTPDCVHPTDG
ncbi:hypothetical protein PV04_01395 [Phialophora macrospora]|uniref:Stc1 domain-containing protein n=1 Tax=Phialophora macrospora TaxID=1851006 RepID=A0A0D2FXQ1_9EURO|nr:hypothetical protein PV04_01395 [Phialophora macrospora]